MAGDAGPEGDYGDLLAVPGAVGVPDEAVAGLAAQFLLSLLADRAAVAVVVPGLHYLPGPGRPGITSSRCCCSAAGPRRRQSAPGCRAYGAISIPARGPQAAARRGAGRDKRRRDSPAGESRRAPGAERGRALCLDLPVLLPLPGCWLLSCAWPSAAGERPSRRAISRTPAFCACQIAMSSRSGNDRKRPDTAGGSVGVTPPAWRNQRIPTAGDTPVSRATSSELAPRPMAAQTHPILVGGT